MSGERGGDAELDPALLKAADALGAILAVSEAQAGLDSAYLEFPAYPRAVLDADWSAAGFDAAGHAARMARWFCMVCDKLWKVMDYADIAGLARQMGEVYVYYWMVRAADVAQTLHSTAHPSGTPLCRDPAFAACLRTVALIQSKLERGVGQHTGPALPEPAAFARLGSLVESLAPEARRLLLAAVHAFARVVPYGSKEAIRTYCFLVGLTAWLRGEPVNWVTEMAALLNRKDKRRCAEILLWVVPKNSAKNGGAVALSKLQHLHFLHASADGIPVEEVVRQVKDLGSPLGGDDAMLPEHADVDRGVPGYWYSTDRAVVAHIAAQPRSNHHTLKISDDTTEEFTVMDINSLAPDATEGWWNAPAYVNQVGQSGSVLGVQVEERGLGRLANYDALHLGMPLYRGVGSSTLVVLNHQVAPDTEARVLSLQKDWQATESFASFAARALSQGLKQPLDEAQLKEVVSGVVAEDPFKSLTVRTDFIDTVMRKVGTRQIYPDALVKVLWYLEPTSANPLSAHDPNLNVVSVVGKILALGDKDSGDRFKHILVPRGLVHFVIKAAAKSHPDYMNDDPLSVMSALMLVNRHEFDGTWTVYGAPLEHDGGRLLCGVYDKAFTITGQHVALHHPAFAGAAVQSIIYRDTSVTVTVALPTGAAVVLVLSEHPNDPMTASGSCTWCGEDTRGADQPHPAVPCTYARNSLPPTDLMDWGDKAYSHLFNALRDIIQSWQGSEFLQVAKAASPVGRQARGHARRLIDMMFPPKVPEMQTKAQGTKAFTLVLSDQPHGLWWWVCQQVLSCWAPKDYAQLDAWILPGGDPADDGETDLSVLTGVRKNAAAELIGVYLTKRMQLQYTGCVGATASRIPPRLASVQMLAGVYPALTKLAQKIDTVSKQLHARLQDGQISHRDFTQCLDHQSAHESNGVVFPPALGRAEFQAPNRDLERIRSVYIELVKGWGLTELGGELRVIDDMISHSMGEELCRLKATAEDWKKRLHKFFSHTHLIWSRVFKAHFRAANTAVRTFDNLKDCYVTTCKALQALSLDTTVADALAGLSVDDEISESYRLQEIRLLEEDIGVSPEITQALLHGAVPLWRMTHALASFRRLVLDPPSGMALRADFFASEADRAVLLQADVSSVLLRDAHAKIQQLRELTCGCDLRVPEVVRTMLACGPLVEFTRAYPSAQDAGLADVLSNTRDIQHASFQTFLNVAPFVNPFVAASADHAVAFQAETERLEVQRREECEAGAKIAPLEVAKESRLRLPVNNRTSDDPAAQPAGFWEMLAKALTDDCTLANIQANLEKMAGADQIELLKKMITEQHTATDRMLDECCYIAGLKEEAAASMVIDLPVTGTPTLACHVGDAVKTTAAYEDLVHRATLQRSISTGTKACDDLGVFLEQAEHALQVFDAACRLYREGHIEFRSRKLTFLHDRAENTMKCMRTLQGRWSNWEATGGSLLGKACEDHERLSCLTSSELVRVVDLIRRASAHGEESVSHDAVLSKPWRNNRARDPTSTAPSDLPVGRAAPTAVVPVARRPPAQVRTDAARMIVSGVAAASGEYEGALWTYRRHDGAVLAPVAQGWSVHLPQHAGGCVVRAPYLASTYNHAGTLPPWQMDQWYEAEAGAHGALSSQPSKTRVRIERKFLTPPQWAEERQSDKVRHITVRTKEALEPLATVTRGASLYVGVVPAGSVWEAKGFEEGMRVCSVQNFVGSDVDMTDSNAAPAVLVQALAAARGAAGPDGFAHFSVEVHSAWIWDHTSKSAALKIDWNARAVVKQAATSTDVSFAVAAAPGNHAAWRVRFAGEVDDAMVGLVGPDFDPKEVKDVDAAIAQGVWYRRDGTLCCRDAREFNSQAAFKTGDIITVSHSTTDEGASVVDFYLNDSHVGRVPAAGPLRPCVGLRRVQASAILIQGVPTHEVLAWSTARPISSQDQSDGWGVQIDGRKITKDSNKGIAAAVGDCVFRGPGPHTFRVRVSKNTAGRAGVPSRRANPMTMHKHANDQAMEALKNIHIGVATPAASRTNKCNTKTDLFALTVNAEGSVYNAQGVLDNNARPQVGIKVSPAEQQHMNFTFVFTVELGDRKSIQVVRQGWDATGKAPREVQLANTNDFTQPPMIEGALCPYVWFEGDCNDMVVELVPKEDDTTVDCQAPSAVVTGSRGGLADGLYKQWLPVYTRCGDGLFQLFHWNKRWCIADLADRPLAWSGEVAQPEELGKKPLKWTLAEGYEECPEAVQLHSFHGTAGTLQRQDVTKGKRGGKVWYGNGGVELFWSAKLSSWLVTDAGGEAAGTAYYASIDTTEFPHHAGTWAVGNGAAFTPCCTVSVTAAPPATPPAATVCVQAHVLSEEAAKSGAVAGLMPDELAAWHIIKKATGVHCSVPELRTALISAGRGKSGVYLDVGGWESPEQAQGEVAEAAKRQLSCIGAFVHAFVGPESPDVLAAQNFDSKAHWYGPLQGKALKDTAVDTSRLPVADRKLFALSLFEGDLRPYHLLDCTPETPVEDVRTFLTLYSRSKLGRFVVFGIQLLRSEAQSEIRGFLDAEAERGGGAAAPETKGLFTIVTGGGASDGPIESLDTTCCNLQWRRAVCAQVKQLNKFKSITYFLQSEGTGKSYAIAKQWKGFEQTRLDLDSTTRSMDVVCQRLGTPFLQAQGLLVIHVGHDTEPSFVNAVLDSLIFLGAVQSRSGLMASVPDGGWHLVIEFQTPPEKEPGHAVNPPWRGGNGSDITLLATWDLGKEGALEPYDVAEHSDHGRGENMLKFLRKNADLPQWDNWRWEDDEKFLRCIAIGHLLRMTDHPPTEEELAVPTARTLTRAFEFGRRKINIYAPPAEGRELTSAPVERHAVVARSVIHEMHFHISNDPSVIDHHHVQVDANNKLRPKSGLLAGKLPEFLIPVLDTYHEHLRMIYRSTATVQTQAWVDIDAPLHTLLTMLLYELDVDQSASTLCLAAKNYALTPDFLQKIFQLHNHIALNDPIVLQGPSGTGKTYAVQILSDLLNLPIPSSTAKDRIFDMQAEVMKFCRSSTEVKNLLFAKTGDIKKNDDMIIGSAAYRTSHPAVGIKDCLNILTDSTVDTDTAMTIIRDALVQHLGPRMNDPDTHPELAGMREKPEFAWDKLRAATDAKEMKQYATSLLESLGKQLTTIPIQSELVALMSAALRSQKMKDLTGSMYVEIVGILNKRHTPDALETWARAILSAEHLGRPGQFKGELLCNAVKNKISELLTSSAMFDIPPELEFRLADTGTLSHPTTGDQLAELIVQACDLKPVPAKCFILMRYDLTPDTLFEEMLPCLRRAVAAPKVTFTVMIDEMNATHMLGLLKRIVVDRYWDKWGDACPELKGKIPSNIAFIGAVNPSQKDAILEGRTDDDMIDAEDRVVTALHTDTVAELGFDVTPMPPALKEHIVPWRQLERKRMEFFISRLVRQNKCVFEGNLNEASLKALIALLIKAHTFAQRECQNKRSTVSQRDIHRTMKVFAFFYKAGADFCVLRDVRTEKSGTEQVALSSMLLGIAFSYYFRFPAAERARLASLLDKSLEQHGLLRVPVAAVIDNAVEYYCGTDHMRFPEAVYAHKALRENLFVQMVCFDLRLAVILEGPPGTSKTLSNNIIRDNMTGSGPFWQELCHISDICRYQGSSQSSADEIRKRCKEAYEKQRESDAAGMKKKRTLLFVDEAGLVKSDSDDRKWALKVLHFYLEGANLAAVLMTNQTLDPAIGNRCVVVFMGKPEPDELTNMCCGILHKQGMRGLAPRARDVIDGCCEAFHKLVPPMDVAPGLLSKDEKAKYRWWYGLRDLFHMMRYIRRNSAAGSAEKDAVTEAALLEITPDLLAKALQRNFNGPKAFFEEVLRVFGETLAARAGGGASMDAEDAAPFSTEDLRRRLMHNLDAILDSIEDNNRATANASGKNLNDMWVRFKLVVDSSDDGSLLQLLRQQRLQIPHFADMQVLRLSTLSKGDYAKRRLMPVTVVSQIAAAMEAGQTVWLTNTREIDACLFELFNQNFVVANSGEINHFAALAIGASLEYRRVHPNFQCVVHVMKKDLHRMGTLLPSPFLNRLEKFSISAEDVLTWVSSKAAGERPYHGLCTRLDAFDRALSMTRGRPLFSAAPRETISSLVLELVNRTEEPAVDPRIAADPALAAFVAHGGEEFPNHWRRAALRLLQLFQLDHMLLAQDLLVHGANGFLRAYFCDLQPWSLRAYLTNLTARPSDAPVVKSVVYSPTNMGFMSLFDDVAHTAFLGMDTLADSERGREQLREGVQRLMADARLRVFGVVVPPGLLGSAEVREVQWLLDGHLADEKLTCGARGKAVVILQAFPTAAGRAGTAAGFTPLFGTGWDQRYIDASGDRPDLIMERYVDEAVVGPGTAGDAKLLAVGPDGEKDAVVRSRLPAALSSLFFAQTGQGWAAVPEADPAAAIYDLHRPFDEQLRVAGAVLSVCGKVTATFGELCAATVPSKPELIKMTKDLAGLEASSSLPQRLVEEEDLVFVKLLAFALRLLLNDRNVSRILQAVDAEDARLVAFVDDFMSTALRIESNRTTFEYLRHVRLDSHPELSVKALMPAVPGSLFLMEQLVIPPSAVNPVAEAQTLREEHDHASYATPTLVGQLVRLVHDNGYVTDFFKDCVRARMGDLNDAKRMEQCLLWVFEMARGLHKSVFGDAAETVYSVHALCCVDGAAIDEYILTWLPLINIGLKAEVKPWEDRPDQQWVAHEQCPDLLIDAFVSGALACPEFMVACSCLLHRATAEWMSQSRALPCLMVVGALLRGEEAAEDHEDVVSACKGFIAACQECEDAPLAFPALDGMLASLTRERVQKVVLVLLDLYGCLGDAAWVAPLCGTLLEYVAKGCLTRAMGARIVGRMLDVHRDPAAHALSNSTLQHMAGVALSAAALVTSPTPPLDAAAVYYPPGRTGCANAPLHQNPVYLALYDSVYDIVIGDDAEHIAGGQCEGTCVALAGRLEALAGLEAEMAAGAAAQAGRALCSVVRAALEVGFLQALAITFQPPPTANKATWAPQIMHHAAFDGIRALAKGLMEPKGFVGAATNAAEQHELLAKPPCATAEYNTLVFLLTLERGASSNVLGMGMKATMGYLQSQVERGDGAAGPLVATCGAWMELRCHSAKSMESSPGDLPFLYNQKDPVYPAYAQLDAAWREYDDPRAVTNGTPDLIGAVRGKVVALLKQFALVEVRLLVFYYAAKRYFLQRHPMFCAYPLCQALLDPLALDAKQQKFLTLMLCPADAELLAEVIWSKSLREALAERGMWAEMVVTTAAVAAARPQTLLHSLVFDIQVQKNCYLPGDKTGNPVVLGGAYKLDCVTQLDPSGQLFSFATNQPVLSHGSCYLLWGIMFAAFALQLGMFRETYSTFSKWVISPELQLKGAASGGKDDSAAAEFLVERFVERSMAYHFHMARNTGLNQDDAQNMYASLVYRFHTATANSPLQRLMNKDRQLALQVEAELEKTWRGRADAAAAPAAPAAAPAASDATTHLKLAEVLTNMPSKLQLLKRVGSVTTALKCLSGYEYGGDGEQATFPKLLSMALMEREKLALLAPLLIEVYHFALAAHRYLSGILPSNYHASGVDRTAYRNILHLFDERCHVAHATRLRGQLASIKKKWNQYRSNVGPINFECEEGGINVEMDLHEAQVGAAGLPDTLDFWIHMSDTAADPEHRNLAQAAVFSLTSQYNECQRIISAYTRIPMEQVHPMTLNPSKPDLVLSEQHDLERRCRSYVADDGTIDWMGIESEISFGSGLIIPPMTSAVLPEWRWSDVGNAKAEEVEGKAREQLALAPPRHSKALTDAQRARMQEVTHRLSEDQSVTFLSWLSDTAEGDRVCDNAGAVAPAVPAAAAGGAKPAPRGNLWSAMMRNRSLAEKKSWFKWEPALQDFFTYELLIDHMAEVLQFFVARVAPGRTVAAHLGAEHSAPVPKDAAAAIDHHFATDDREQALGDLEGIALLLQQDWCAAAPPREEMAPLLLKNLHGVADDKVVEKVFAPLRFEHLAGALTLIDALKKRLCGTERRHWVEPGGNFAGSSDM